MELLHIHMVLLHQTNTQEVLRHHRVGLHLKFQMHHLHIWQDLEVIVVLEVVLPFLEEALVYLSLRVGQVVREDQDALAVQVVPLHQVVQEVLQRPAMNT